MNHIQSNRSSDVKFRQGAAGLHVFDRIRGINLLVDELRFPPIQWAKAPRFVSIALTNACDLECRYCYAPKIHAVLDQERLRSWLIELDENGCLGIGFGGGEPLLYPSFLSLCRFAERNTGMAVSFTTHGHHLDDDLLAELKGCVHFVRISMDGIGATYELHRGRSFSALLGRLEKLSGLAPFGINYVVNSKSLPELDEAVRLAAEVGASEFLLLPERPTSRTGGIDRCCAETLKAWIQAYRGSVRLTIGQGSSHGLPICDPLESEQGLDAYCHIDASAAIKRTSYDLVGVTIGTCRLMSSLQILRDSKELCR